MKAPRTGLAAIILFGLCLKLEAGSVAVEDFDTTIFNSVGESVSGTISASWGTYSEGVFSPLFGATQSTINSGYFDSSAKEFFVLLTQSDNTLLSAGTPLFLSIFNVPGGSGSSTWTSSSEQMVLSDPTWVAPTFALTTPSLTWSLGATTFALPLAQFGNLAGRYDHNGGSPKITLVSAAPEPPPAPTPVINSPAWPVAVVGQTFSYQITASGEPTVYGASNLPGGLTIDTTNGLITGTPTEPGEFDVTISATNAGGTGNATFTLTISPAPVVAPVISDNTASGTVGTAFTYQISASNSPTSFGAIGLPAGLILDPATGFITGTPTTATTSSVTISATNAGGTGNATLTLTIGAAPPPPFLAPGTYNLPAGAKVKLGVTPPQGSAKYQWLKSGAPVKRATGPELDLTPGTTTFGPAQTGVYQLRQQQGTTVTTLGPWVLTHDDPTILVYNLTLNGTQSTSPDDSRTKGASESAVTMGGFLLVDRTPYDGDPPTADVKATLILTRIDRVGKKVVGSFYWVEPRPDASVHSNGPVPGTKSFPPSRTLVAGLLGTEQRENDPESPLWLAGDRDLLWLSGSDSLVALNKSRPPSLIVAPAVMNGVLGTVKATEGIEIGNLTVTARVNAADTLRARNEALNMEGLTRFIVDRLKEQKPPFTEIPPGQ